MGSEIWINHYSSKHKILLVGEGDFSFAACLANAFGHASNIVATSLDSEGTLKEKYPTAEANLTALETRGSTIIHGVSVRTMADHSILEGMLFDRIVFNFPHAGFSLPEHDERQIRRHQKVVRRFLENARTMLKKGGQVHITHKTAHPFCQWEIEELGKEAGLRLIEEAHFDIDDYPGYVNRSGADKTVSIWKNKVLRVRSSRDTFRIGACVTFKFVRKW